MAETRYRKGDVVRFLMVNRYIQGVVKEDRGNIGVKGRRLYAVEFRYEPQAESLSLVELPAEDLELVRDTVTSD